MASCHFIVAGLVGSYEGSWKSHVAAGWVCIVFVWVSYIPEGVNFTACGAVLSRSVRGPMDVLRWNIVQGIVT